MNPPKKKEIVVKFHGTSIALLGPQYNILHSSNFLRERCRHRSKRCLLHSVRTATKMLFISVTPIKLETHTANRPIPFQNHTGRGHLAEAVYTSYLSVCLSQSYMIIWKAITQCIVGYF